MKIKKKDYKKNVSDAYWNGVKIGIAFALDNPKMAEKYRDRVEEIRSMSEKMCRAMERLAKGINKAFYQVKDDTEKRGTE